MVSGGVHTGVAQLVTNQVNPPLPQLSALVGSSSSRRSKPTNKKKTRLPPVVLSSSAFASFWAMLVVVHAAHAVFLIACARLYYYLEHPYLSYYADLLAPPEDRHSKLFGAILGFLGAWSAVECLSIVLASIRARRPAIPSFGNIETAFHLLKRLFSLRHRRRHDTNPRAVHVTPKKGQPVRRNGVHMVIEESVDLFSIESERFDSVFTVREIVVTATQVVQCYTYSSRIARPWINHVSVALVVANCVSVAVLYRLLRRYDQFIKRSSVRNASVSSPSWRASPAFARLLCHVLDCLLTFAMSVLLPVAVFAPYAAVYDAELFTFPLSLIYSDTEFPNMIRENQALFARSLMYVGYKLVPHLSIYFCLVVIASVLRTGKEPQPTVPSVPTSIAVQPSDASSPSTGRSSARRSDQDRESVFLTRPVPMLSVNGIKTRFRRSAVAVGFMVVAATVLILHLRASISNSAGRVMVTAMDGGDDTAVNLCAQPVYPWFSSGDSCAVIEFNCRRMGVVSPPLDAFDRFDPSTVSSVIFTHCPALVVPPAIRSFTNLIGIELYNCTIVEWSVDAALTDDRHPDLIFLILVYVNMTELPPGVLQSPFPAKLGDIELSKTNLSALPASLPEVWADVELVYFEHSLFTEAPRELLAIPALSELSLIGNAIAQLPVDLSDLVAADDFYFLALAGNPLSSLPSTLRSSLSFGFLSLEATDLLELPDWVEASVYEGLYLYNSPLCSSDAVETDESVAAGCAARDDRGDGRYPHAVTAPMRAI